MDDLLDLFGFIADKPDTDKKEEKDQKDYLHDTNFLIDEMQKLEILTYTPYCQKGIFSNYKTPIGGIEPYYLGVYDFLKSKQIIQEKPEGLDRFQYTINPIVLKFNEEQFKAFFEQNEKHKDLINIYKCFPIIYGKLLAFLKNVYMTKTAPPPQQPAPPQLVQNQMAQQNQIALQNRRPVLPQRGIIAGPQRVQGGTKRKKTRFIKRRLRRLTKRKRTQPL
jgi:hypothetical protein